MLFDPLRLETPTSGFNGGLVIKPDGTLRHETSRSGAAADAEALGADAGDELKRRAGPAFLNALG